MKKTNKQKCDKIPGPLRSKSETQTKAQNTEEKITTNEQQQTKHHK